MHQSRRVLNRAGITAVSDRTCQRMIESLEARRLLCGLHDAGDPEMGTLPLPEATPVSAPPGEELPTSAPPPPQPLSALPQLSSRPNATQKIYLDFNGEFVGAWGTNNDLDPPAPYVPGSIPAYDSDGDVNSYSDAELTAIDQIWKTVSEKFSPFDVDVTTIDPGNRNNGQTMACVIGGGNGWLGSGGGVAYVNAFTNSRENTCFVFTQGVATNITFAGAGAAHELGHAFGLEHQGITASGVVTTEYSSGTGQTVPIMGNANNTPTRRGIWFNGEANNRGATNNLVPLGIQNDLTIITDGHNNFGNRPDDYNAPNANPSLFINDNQGHLSASGIIGVSFDTDGWKFSATGNSASFTMRNAEFGGMLSPRLELRDATGLINIPATTSISANGNSVTLSVNNLTLGGQYVIVARGDLSYGSIGQYSITGNMTVFAFAAGGTLYVHGFLDSNDDIQIDYLFANGEWKYYVDLAYNGDPSQLAGLLIPASLVDDIEIRTFSGNDTVRFRNINVTAPVSITMDSGTDLLRVDGTQGADLFSIYNNFFVCSSTLFTTDGSIENVSLHGDDGNDTFTVSSWGDSNLNLYGDNNDDIADIRSNPISTGANITFEGGNHNDTQFINDAGNIDGRSFLIGFGFVQVTNLGVTRNFNYSGAELLRVLGGSGNDDFRATSVSLGLTVQIEGGNGDDDVELGTFDGFSGASFSGNIRGTVNILAGGGTDSLALEDRAYSDPANYHILLASFDNTALSGGLVSWTSALEKVDVHGKNGGHDLKVEYDFNTDLNLFGGSGSDTLRIDQRNLYALGAPTKFELDDTSFANFHNTTAYRYDYSGYEMMYVDLNNQTTNFDVRGVSPDLSPLVGASINCGTNNDNITIFPQDGAGNLAMVRKLVIYGNLGVNQLTIDDSASTAPITYDFFHAISAATQNIGGMGAGTLDFNNVQQILLNAGSGDDVFNIRQAQSGAALTINGNDGGDALNVSPTLRNLASTFTNTMPFSFNGGGGTDYVNIYNDNSPNQWQYTRTAADLIANRTTGSAFTTTFALGETEWLSAYGGTLGDQFYVKATPSGSSENFNGLGSDDTYYVGSDAHTLDAIGGVIGFQQNGGADALFIDDTGSTIAKSYHMQANAIGAGLGDNLLPAGYISHSGITGQIRLDHGSGSETIYAAPDLGASVILNGNNPSAAPGDRLFLNLANVTSPAISDFGGGAGQLNSTSHQPMYWGGIEQVSTQDVVAPTVIARGFALSLPRMSLYFQFTEDVSASFNRNALLLENTFTNATIPTGDIFSAWAGGTNTGRFTFDNHTNGVLPDGHYRATLAASVQDAAGNPLANSEIVEFSFLQADATGDLKVDTRDFNTLSGHFGDVGVDFSEGDFDFSGNVESNDFNILVGQYGKSLPAPASIAAAGTGVFSASSLDFDNDKLEELA